MYINKICISINNKKFIFQIFQVFNNEPLLINNKKGFLSQLFSKQLQQKPWSFI